jgi:transposase
LKISINWLAHQFDQCVKDAFTFEPHRLDDRPQGSVGFRPPFRAICIDMCEIYANAVEESLPGAPLIVDRFHVAKAYRGCADKLRIEEQHYLKQILEEGEYSALKGVMWPFRVKPENLKEEEKKQLELLFECSPELKNPTSCVKP